MTVAQAVQPWIRVEPPRFDPAATRAWMRLIKAFALSAVVHAMVMVALVVDSWHLLPVVANHFLIP